MPATYDPSTKELFVSATTQLFDPAAYTLKTSDGTVYSINGATGAITSSTNPNGTVIQYAGDSITSGNLNLHIDRNDDNTIRAVQVADALGNPVGNPINYTYNYGELAAVQARDGATTQYAYTDSAHPHFLTTVTDARGVPVLNAAYNSLGQLSGLTDASNNPATVGTGGDDGSGDSQTVTDLTPQHNTTQEIYDDHGDVTRQIKSITEAAGNVTGYEVTVHQYTYFTGDLSAKVTNIFTPLGAGTQTSPGASNQNVIASQTDYQTFTVSALADALNQQPSTVSREVDFGLPEDPSQPGADAAAQGLPTKETDTLAGGATRVTEYGDYKLGRPRTTTVKIFAADVSPDTGTPAQTAVTRSFIDDAGNLRLSFDALGQGTEYDYNGQGQLTETWQVANWSGVNPATFSVNNSNTWPAKLTTLAQSQNVYYADGDTTPGAYAGQVKYRFDAARQKSVFAYDALGNQVLAYKLVVTAGQPSRWVGTTTTYDLGGRPRGTVNAVYADNGSGTLPLAAVIASGTGIDGVPPIKTVIVNATAQQSLQTSGTAYTAVGQTDITTDQYGKQTRNLYDINNNVVQTANSNGTVVRSIYDSMQRVIWQTDPFDPASSTPVLATHTIYNSLGQVSATERWTGTDIHVTTSGAISTVTLASAGTLIPGGGTSTIYNSQGQVAETTNAAGLRTGTIYYPDGEVQFAGPINDNIVDSGPDAWFDNIPAVITPTYLHSLFAGYTENLYNQVDSNGQLYNRVIDGNGHHTDTYTDVLGRTTKTVFDDGSFTETLYSVSGAAISGYYVSGTGLPTIPAGGSEKVEIAQRKTDDPIVATIYVSDASGNLIDVYQPAVPDPANDNTLVRPRTSYVYDSAGNEILHVTAEEQAAFRLWLALGNTAASFTGGTAWTFDQNSNQLTRTLPDGESESFTYNLYSQDATHTDFDGNVATYTYLPASDRNAGSLYQVVYVGADSSKATETVNYTYTGLGQPATVSNSAEATADNPLGTTTLSYDPQGDVTVQETPQGVIHHAFDAATGQLTETWTDFTDVAYSYNLLGELWKTTVNKLNGQTLATPLTTATIN